MDSTLYQIQINNDLAKKASEIFSLIGLDLQSAVQLFLKRSVQAQGIPFSMRISDKREESTDEAITAMINMSRMAEEAGIADMTLDEINAEIDSVRHGERDE